ncbi:MAG: hypothetical protein RBR65_00545 [Aliarcobacter sp.]|jgi:anaerobic C4-dicarboxylate transporter|nr:hypothetical protein [Aliarcobacter sp.]
MCEFYKNMNIFFAKLAMLVAASSVVIFIGGILYVLFLGLFNEKALSEFDFNDIAMFLIYTIVPFATSISIINKIEPDIFLKEKI